ncbi:hypothetical protein DERF_010486 [Dermatophagoides farinae]|uniref:Uncharacterized protein n=1 Tax=Dermatophagoides farinae TaxID=6954 RepID=A0A922L235_DERFA|nr:hypothetical protein DERF_010486 [Dermatophagoides farinae]
MEDASVRKLLIPDGGPETNRAELESSPLTGSSIQIRLGIRTDVSSIARASRFLSPPEQFCTIVLAVLAMSNSLRRLKHKPNFVCSSNQVSGDLTLLASSNWYETTEIELCRTGQFGFHFAIENLQQRRFARTGAAHDCIQCSKLKLSTEIP